MKAADARRILSKLKKLRALARLAPGEEKNEGRVNEARASALLMLKIAEDNGFVVQFALLRSGREIEDEIVTERREHVKVKTEVRHGTPVAEPEEPFPWDQDYERYKYPAQSYAQAGRDPFNDHPGAPVDVEDTVGRRDGPHGAGNHCVCGKPIETRTWYSPGQGCTHRVDRQGAPYNR